MGRKYLDPNEKKNDRKNNDNENKVTEKPDRYEKADKTMQRGYKRSDRGLHTAKSWTTTEHDLEIITRIRMRLFPKGIEPSRSEIVNVAIKLAEEASDERIIEEIQKRRR